MQWNWQIDTEPGTPEQNMAVDAALLAGLSEEDNGYAAIRVYSWDRPSVSIGRLQNEDSVRELYPDFPIVRRPTGGRAVLHGDDLTISVALRLDRLPTDCRTVLTSHQLIMDGVKVALEKLGLDICFGGYAIGSQRSLINCFELAASCDLVDSHTGKKLVGSAQRREGPALLQQISLPLRIVPDKKAFLVHLKSAYQSTFAIREWCDVFT
ncbi:MAG: lipoate--protein ligase family protein [Janthinobacterium lividum]